MHVLLLFILFIKFHVWWLTYHDTHTQTHAHTQTWWYEVNNWWPLPCYVGLYGKCMGDILTIFQEAQKGALQHCQGGTIWRLSITFNYLHTLILFALHVPLFSPYSVHWVERWWLNFRTLFTCIRLHQEFGEHIQPSEIFFTWNSYVNWFICRRWPHNKSKQPIADNCT